MNARVKSQGGVSLFEMMLVLIIISLVYVSVMQYLEHQRDLAAGTALGGKLYTYGQAVRQYILDTQGTMRATPQGTVSGVQPTSGGDGSYTFTGVAWLQPGTANPNPDPSAPPYLDPSFTFNIGMEPLYVGPTQGGSDAGITTKVSFQNPKDLTSPMIVEVDVPILYKTIKGVAQPKPDISAEAAKYANTYYDSAAGGAAFNYSYTVPTDGKFAGTNIVGFLKNVSSSEAYLRVDGQNYMKQTIVFYDPTDNFAFAAPTDPTTRNILGVERIFFDTTAAHAPTGITGIDTILFDSGNTSNKTIQGLDSISFNNAAAPNTSNINNLAAIQFIGLGSTINSMQAINFIPASTGFSYISNINYLTFSSNAGNVDPAPPNIAFPNNDGLIAGLNKLVFSGTGSSINSLGTLNVGTVNATTLNAGTIVGAIQLPSGDVVNQLTVATYGTGDMSSVNTSFCAVAHMQVKTAGAGTPADCNVYRNGSVWHLDKDGDGSCGAICLIWD